jgi:acyl phosphate:glycerol-3-phosphate acyltransferase
MSITTSAPWIALLLPIAYLLGSLPTGYLAGRWLQGIDIRQEGSGSTGATNVLRTLGKGPGAAVLAIDVLKGVAAVRLVPLLGLWGWSIPQPAVVMVLCAAMALVGHSKSVWLGWRGGKSVATGLGVLLALNSTVALLALGVFGLAIALSRIVSISSILAALAAPVLMAVFQQPIAYIVFTAVGGGFVIWLHRANIRRLGAGTEPRLGQKLPEIEAAETIEAAGDQVS